MLVIAKTVIGKGAPTKAGTHGCHGAPLGAEEVSATKKALGFDPEKSFFVPQEVYDVFAARGALCHRWRNKDVKDEKEEAKRRKEEGVAEAARDLIAPIKEFVALDAGARMEAAEAFCDDIARRIGALEAKLDEARE